MKWKLWLEFLMWREGVRNGRVSKIPSVASMELSFLGQEGEVNDFLEENNEEEERVEKVFINEEVVSEILEKNEINVEVLEKNEGVTEGTKEISHDYVEEVGIVEIDLNTRDGDFIFFILTNFSTKVQGFIQKTNCLI